LTMVFIYPPIEFPSNVHLALPIIVSYLKQNDLKDYKVIDANLLYWKMLFSLEFYRTSLAKITRRFHELDQKASLGLRQSKEYVLCLESLVFLEEKQEEWLDLAEYFKNPDGFGEEYEIKSKMFFCFLKHLSARYYPQMIYPFNPGQELISEIQIKSYAASENNVFKDFFLDTLLSHIRQSDHTSVVFTVPYWSSFIAFCCFSRIIRKTTPEMTIFAGGSFFTYLKDLFITGIDWFGFFTDVLVFGDNGHNLIKYIPNGSREIVLNDCILYKNDKKIHYDHIERNHRPAMFVVPDFSDFNFGEYYSPHPVLPVISSAGCYWRKCKFCTHYQSYGKEYLAKEIDDLINEIKFQVGTYQTGYFYFVDEAILPSKINALCDCLEKEKLTISWMSALRFEKQFDWHLIGRMKRAGLKFVLFGLESGSDDLLKRMEKGTEIKVIQKIINDFAENRIMIQAMLFLGFPGENSQSIEQTKTFLSNNAGKIKFIGFGPFGLGYNSPVFNDQKAYNIEAIIRPTSQNVQFRFGYKGHNGVLSDGEVKEIVGNMQNEMAPYYPFVPVGRVHGLFFRNAERFSLYKRNTNYLSLSERVDITEKMIMFIQFDYFLIKHDLKSKKEPLMFIPKKQGIIVSDGLIVGRLKTNSSP
jgi:anaerobic magnesium-protoporphyrin IX monomethyl ester cyclase